MFIGSVRRREADIYGEEMEGCDEILMIYFVRPDNYYEFGTDTASDSQTLFSV